MKETSANARYIRVALLFETLMQPAWIVAAVRNILDFPFAEIASVICLPNTTKEKDGQVYQAYHCLDRRFFKTELDPFSMSSIERLMPDCQLHYLNPALEDNCYDISKEKIDQTDLNLADVCVYFGARRLKGEILKKTKFGIWTYGGGVDWHAQQEGVWTVLKGQPVTSVALWVMQENPQKDIPIYRSTSSTITYSVQLNYTVFLWKAAEFVKRKLMDVYLNGDQALNSLPTNEDFHEDEYGFQATPNNADMLRAFPCLIKNYMQSKLELRVHKPQWFIAYKHIDRFSIKDIDLKDSVYLDPPPGSHWADPFPYVAKDGRKYIFFEEIPQPGAKGHISVVDISVLQGESLGQPKEDSRMLKLEVRPTIVLEKDYHLSYPFLLEWHGELFMIPESSKNRTVEIYRCKKFPNEWELETRLLENINAVDSTLVEIDQQWWMFANLAGQGGGSNDELSLFFAPKPFGPWKAHPANPIISDVRYARPAGKIIQINGNFYRPAQDCSGRYGRQIVLNQINEITCTTYREKPVHIIQPDWRKSLLATHTLNFADDLMVVDGYRSTKGAFD